MKPEDLYTYVTDICNISTSDISYKGLKIVPSYSAARELMKHSKTLADIAEMLEHGYDAPRKRSKGKIEKWLDKGKKTLNAVVVKDHNEIEDEDVWVLIHFGMFTKRR